MTAVLEISDYSLSYRTPSGPVRILSDIDLSIARGEVLGLVGESGSAKSSLANAIIRDLPGRVETESGEILLSGVSLMGLPAAALEGIRGKRIAMVFQNPSTSLDPTQTLGDHLLETLATLPGRPVHADARGRAIELLELVGLPDPGLMMGRYAHEVSGGEKQRVVLALALACDPELILFDEPTSALDATTAFTFLELFRKLRQRTGVAALFISHDLGVVSDIADRVAVIYGGRIVEMAETAALFRAARHPYTGALLASLPRPSDTRTGRQLAATVGKPAPRRGPPPNCIYAAACAFHRAEICDRGPVRLDRVAGHKVACARIGSMGTPGADYTTGNELPAPGGRIVLSARNMNLRFSGTSWFARRLGQADTQVHAVNNASIAVAQGETLGIVGESGCGKSTLARALAGLLPYSGALVLDGEPLERIDAAYRARVQIIFQDPDSSLNPRHSVGTILSRPLKLFRPEIAAADRPAEIASILERVRLPADHARSFPHQLSGGEKQRVAIARALAASPDVIICDEITSGLDAAVQAAIVRLLRDIQRRTGQALIFITHDLAILRHVAHRVAVMYLGEIVEARTVASLDHAPYHPYTEALLSSSAAVDPAAETRRVRLSGSLPRRTERLAGCAFESRCPRRVDGLCASTRPPLREPAAGHRISCHLPDAELARIPPIWHFDVPRTLEGTP